mgnify:CR=1 FL=1
MSAATRSVTDLRDLAHEGAALVGDGDGPAYEDRVEAARVAPRRARLTFGDRLSGAAPAGSSCARPPGRWRAHSRARVGTRRSWSCRPPSAPN